MRSSRGGISNSTGFLRGVKVRGTFRVEFTGGTQVVFVPTKTTNKNSKNRVCTKDTGRWSLDAPGHLCVDRKLEVPGHGSRGPLQYSLSTDSLSEKLEGRERSVPDSFLPGNTGFKERSLSRVCRVNRGLLGSKSNNYELPEFSNKKG